MKNDVVKNRIKYLEKQIAMLIATRQMLDDKEKEKMLRNIENLMVQSHEEVSSMVSDDLKKVYESELDKAVKYLQDNGIDFATALNSQVHAGALDVIIGDTMLDLSSAYRTAQQRLVSNIEQTLDKVKQSIADGTMYGNTRRKTVKAVYDDFYTKGLTSFTTIDGKELPLDFYAETLVRTKTSTASINAHINTYEEADVDLVEVVGSSDPCGECAPYHNVVFSLHGNDERFPQLDVKSMFPLHPNCRCNVLPYILEYETNESIDEKISKGQSFDPDKDTRTKEQKEMYDDIQRRRRIARQETKQYDKMKSVLGNDAPKTIGAYRRMKRANSKRYKELQAKMRELNKHSV